MRGPSSPACSRRCASRTGRAVPRSSSWCRRGCRRAASLRRRAVFGPARVGVAGGARRPDAGLHRPGGERGGDRGRARRSGAARPAADAGRRRTVRSERLDRAPAGRGRGPAALAWPRERRARSGSRARTRWRCAGGYGAGTSTCCCRGWRSCARTSSRTRRGACPRRCATADRRRRWRCPITNGDTSSRRCGRWATHRRWRRRHGAARAQRAGAWRAGAVRGLRADGGGGAGVAGVAVRGLRGRWRRGKAAS